MLQDCIGVNNGGIVKNEVAGFVNLIKKLSLHNATSNMIDSRYSRCLLVTADLHRIAKFMQNFKQMARICRAILEYSQFSLIITMSLCEGRVAIFLKINFS